MSDDSEQSSPNVTVVYTGTRAPTFEHARLRVVHMPMLEAAPVDFDHKEVQLLVKQPCTLVFYSQNSVHVVAQSGIFDAIDLSNHSVWAVGEKTAEAIAARFGVAAKTPDDERFEGLVETFERHSPALPAVAFGLKDSPRSLAAALAETSDVYDVPVYRTCPRLYPGLAQKLAEIDADWIAFTSPRGVATFISQACVSNGQSVDFNALRLAAIGPTTAGALQERGLEPSLVVETPDKNEMMAAILDY